MAITGFPSGGYNFQAKTPNITTHAISGSTAWATVSTVSGSGLLTGIGQVVGGTAGTSALKITLDGNLIYDSSLGVDYSGNQTLGMSFAHKFNTSMLVEHKIDNSSGNLTTTVSYLTN